MKFNKLILSAVALLSLASCQPSDTGGGGNEPKDPVLESERYQNPIIMADCPDPSVVREGDTLYIFGTSGRVYKCEDLRTGMWTQLPDVIRTVEWGNTFNNIWAPDVFKVGDTWNYYYSVSIWGDENPGIGVMTSSSLEGPWTDHGKIFDSKEIGVDNSIDPCVFEDNGQIYMAWGSFRGLFLIELNEDGTALKNPETAAEDKTLIAGVVGPWNGSTYEGLYIRKIGEYFYMFASQGTCCDGANSTYHVKVARSTSPYGPYVDSEGVDMCGYDRGELVVQGDQNVAGPGHCSFFIDDNDDYWLVYHGYDRFSPTGRYVFMDKLLWDENGFPYVQGYVPSYMRNVRGPKINYND